MQPRPSAASWLGVKLDPARNENGKTDITGEASAVRVLVIPANEELTDARGVLAGFPPA